MAEVRENEPSEQLSEAEASEAARRYLFRRFWTSGLGFWNTRRAWVLTIGHRDRHHPGAYFSGPGCDKRGARRHGGQPSHGDAARLAGMADQ
jgi:hypothetical protein